jgi:hypothetical protein
VGIAAEVVAQHDGTAPDGLRELVVEVQPGRDGGHPSAEVGAAGVLALGQAPQLRES